MKESFKQEEKQITDWLETLRFKKQIFGGVNEQDVWNKLNELNDLYETALIAERARYDALIDYFKETGIEQDHQEITGDE